jgi:hypothetical protein
VAIEGAGKANVRARLEGAFVRSDLAFPAKRPVVVPGDRRTTVPELLELGVAGFGDARQGDLSLRASLTLADFCRARYSVLSFRFVAYCRTHVAYIVGEFRSSDRAGMFRCDNHSSIR